MPKHGENVVARNKKALHDYFIEETFEAGLVLRGTEIKSIRQGNVQLKESYARVRDGECYIIGMHISPFDQGNIHNHDPLRDKKALLHKQQIRKIEARLQKEGVTLVPLSIKLVNGFAKCDLGIAKGKQVHDKRQDLKEKQAKREMASALKRNY
jgi:SsrA-binding protein